ncbi:MAG: ATPase [Firmicutes bacterium]|nr:ATPase [Bacillota bacterium]
MDALLDYLDEIEEVLETSKTIPFSGKVSVEKARILDIISEIRLHLPEDIRQAQRILNDHDKILADAEHKAIGILEAAEAEAKLMVNSHELFKRASEQAAEIMEEAKKNARELRAGASAYVDEKLEDAEKQMKEYMANLEAQHKRIMAYYTETIDVLYENRQELRR